MDFFKKPDPKEQLRGNNRLVRKANRDLEGDRRALDRREKELENEIRKLAKQGHREACSSLAKQLVQLRKHRTKSVGLSAQLTGLQSQNSHMYAMGRMSNVMGETVNTMKAMDKQMPITSMAKNMREFQMAQERIGMSEEMLNEAMDGIFSDPADSAAEDAVVSQVLDEIGIEMNGKLSSIPNVPTSETQPLADTDLDQMLAKLRG